jgi:hypothetical protein
MLGRQGRSILYSRDLHHLADVLAFGNPWTINGIDVSRELNPVLKGIATSYNVVRSTFERLNGNCKKAVVSKNPIFKVGVRNNNL